MKMARDVAAATALSRAQLFAGRLPTISEKFLEYALSLSEPENIKFSDDQKMSLFGTLTGTAEASEVVERIKGENGPVACDPGTEQRWLSALLVPATSEELTSFMCHPWRFEDNVRTREEFGHSLPASWH